MTAAEERATADAMRSGDKEARARFIRRNLRLVVRIAAAMKHVHLPMDDRIAAGNVGLIIAVDRFEPERGLRFTTYGSWWIRAEIERQGQEQRLVHLPPLRVKDTPQIAVSMDAVFPQRHEGMDPVTLHDIIADAKPNAEANYAEAEHRARVRELLCILSPRERRVIELRFGFDDGEEKTLAEIGKVDGGVSRERIRQIEARALKKIRKAIKWNPDRI